MSGVTTLASTMEIFLNDSTDSIVLLLTMAYSQSGIVEKIMA